MTGITTTQHVMKVAAGARATGPDEDGWMGFESTGETEMRCSCGLRIAGPREHVGPLVDHHVRDTSAGG